jgi:hypothetical protein
LPYIEFCTVNFYFLKIQIGRGYKKEVYGTIRTCTIDILFLVLNSLFRRIIAIIANVLVYLLKQGGLVLLKSGKGKY